MNPVVPCPVARLRVAPRIFAIVDTHRLEELREGPAWSLWRRRGTRFVARWMRDAHGRRRMQGLLSVVACARPWQWVVPKDGDWLNCTEANAMIVVGTIARVPSGRNPFELRIRIRGHTYRCGAWPSWKYADEIRADLAPIVQQARQEVWNRREIREAIDRETGRIRDRVRGPNRRKSTTEIIRGEDEDDGRGY